MQTFKSLPDTGTSPTPVPDQTGEWIELYNRGGGVTAGSEESRETTVEDQGEWIELYNNLYPGLTTDDFFLG